MRALAPAFAATLALALAVAATQLWPGGSSASALDAVDGTAASVEVIPHVEQVLERGHAQRFRAIVRDRGGAPLEGATVTWSVTPRVGTIDATGLFVATRACLPWDGIGIVTATLPSGVRGRPQLSDGVLVVVHYDPGCLPPPSGSEGDGQR